MLCAVTSLIANTYSFRPYSIKQPNGSLVDCFVSGDEYFNWIHDKDGYTIIQAEDGYFYYGETSGDFVMPGKFRVNEIDPNLVGLKKWARISEKEYKRIKARYEQKDSRTAKAPHTGILNNIVVYIKFVDDAEFENNRQYFDDKFNLIPGASLKSYFQEVSYTQFMVNSTHYPECEMNTNLSYTDSHPRNYFEPYNATTNPNGYSNEGERTYREHTLLRDAMDWIDVNSPVPAGLNIDGDNDGYVDNMCFTIRGGNGAWASLLWAHSWSLFSYNVYINGKQIWKYTFQPETQLDVQTICHEMFHSIGAPDLYHYSYDGLHPVQSWDLMDSGFGHMGAYMKWKYANQSWIAGIPEITVSGTYTLNPLSSSTNNCFKIASQNSTSEFFVVEYRKKTGIFEGTLPGSGLVVYRIDPAVSGNSDGPPDEVYIYRPDGTTNENGNPYSAYFSLESGRTAINNGSNPGSFLQNGAPGGLDISNVTSAGNTISFTVGINTVEAPSYLSATAVSPSQIDLHWLKNNSNDNVLLAWNTSPVFGNPVAGTVYSPGNTIIGGGNVLYSGADSAFSQVGLTSSTTYYYKLWSLSAGNAYSYGINQDATTLCNNTALPYSQNFYSEILPSCWSTQYSGTDAENSWSLSQTTNAGGLPFELKSSYQEVNNGVTRVVMPPLFTVDIPQLDLTFRHKLDGYSTGAILRVQSSPDGVNWRNEAWSLASTSSNVGPAIVNTTVTNPSNSATTFIAFTVEGDLYQYDYWYIDDISVSIPITKSLDLKLFLEGLYNGTTMNKARNASGYQFAGNVADQITVELHAATIPYSLVEGPFIVDLNTDGTAAVSIPSHLNASYYIVVKHRNNVETWSSMPVSFSGSSINYDYSSSASQAFGNNQKLIAGNYAFFTGDVNQDGVVDLSDMVMVDNDAVVFLEGYELTDINGDSIINSDDISFIENNASIFVKKVTP
jgi:M6 family metalloprotease-like protein